MALKKLTLLASERHRGLRLDQVMAVWLPEALSRKISKAKVRKLIVAGAVYLNGRRVRIASKIMLPRARIEVFVDLQKLDSDSAARDQRFIFKASDILFEDEFLIVVNKPSGLPTQPTLDESRDNLFAALKKFLAQRENVVEPYVGLHHRLDRDTSGAVLFTKDRSVNAAIAECFARHKIEKTYLALTPVRGDGLRREWSVKNYLGKDRHTKGKSARFCSVRSGGDFAHTDFSVKERYPSGLLLEVRPRTGRTHQIRVHLAEEGLPILGDIHYGGETHFAKRVMLHAVSLRFSHPVTKAEIFVESPLPGDFVQCLDLLKR